VTTLLGSLWLRKRYLRKIYSTYIRLTKEKACLFLIIYLSLTIRKSFT